MTKQQSKKFLILSLLFVAIMLKLMFLGSPICKCLARNTVNRYISEYYPDCYISGEITYSPFSIGSGNRAVIKSYTDETFERSIYTDFLGLTIDKRTTDFLN